MSDNNTTMRVIVERHPNPDVITFHTDRPLTVSHETQYFRVDEGVVKIAPSIEPVTSEPFAQAVAEHIYAIPGVTSDYMGGVGISQYEIRVQKAKAFEQDEIEKPVLKVIAEAFGQDTLDVRRIGQSSLYPRQSITRDDDNDPSVESNLDPEASLDF